MVLPTPVLKYNAKKVHHGMCDMLNTGMHVLTFRIFASKYVEWDSKETCDLVVNSDYLSTCLSNSKINNIPINWTLCVKDSKFSIVCISVCTLRARAKCTRYCTTLKEAKKKKQQKENVTGMSIFLYKVFLILNKGNRGKFECFLP